MQQLALFPLQLVVFPGEALNLHIFEPRYQQLVADAEREGIRFGVPTVIKGKVQPIATEVSLSEIARRSPTGESDIRTIGNRIFRIEQFLRNLPDKLYPGGLVEYLPSLEEEDPAINREIVSLTREIYTKLKIEREVTPVSAGFRTFEIGHYIGLTLEQEYRFLSFPLAEDRQRFVLKHLQHIKPQLGDPLGIRARAELNGHFKELHPPDF